MIIIIIIIRMIINQFIGIDSEVNQTEKMELREYVT